MICAFCGEHGRHVAARLLARAFLASLAVLAATTVPAAAAPAGAGSRCFGAAARVVALGCADLSRSMVPALGAAERTVACRPVRAKLGPICAFGVSGTRASRHIALIGDSHAMNWRGALDVVARDRRWHGSSIALPGCMFSTAAEALPESRREPCMRWARGVRAWFGRHPEVSTVFVSQNAAMPIEVATGRRYSDIMRDGYAQTWKALPPTVTKIIVLRDAPVPGAGTLLCLRRVLTAGTQRPGPACATARAVALKWDPAVAAVIGLHARRYRFVDMTPFFCGRRDCRPVIGGVRVYSDELGHFTTAFARTLGPYVLRDVRRMFATW